MSIKLRAKLEQPKPRWVRFLRKRGFTACTKFDGGQLDELKKRLLDIAGFAVVLPAIEDDLENIMKKSKLWRGYNSISMKGEACHCHTNVCHLYMANRQRTRICTGYAMSRDQAWRQHSWCVDLASDRPIETTEKRVLYYGFMMTLEECRQFCFENGA